jgi:DNA-binding XRE family transcriptional regulator
LKTIVEHSANVLRNWPENYHLLLNRIGNATASAADNAIGFNTRFTSYYNSMFKHRKYVQALSFLRQEYVRFGCQFWGENTVDDRTLRYESRRKRDKSKEDQPKISITYDKRWVSKAEMARRLGVTVDTIQQLAKDGLLPMKVVTVNRSKRYIIDTESVRVPARTDGTTLRYRAAASCVGLPADVLKALRESEHYKVSHLPSRRAAFHEKDVENFRLLLLQRTGLSSGERPSSEIAFSLAEVMKKLKFGSAKMKAKFVADYLDGHIAALGRFGDTTADIYFDKSMATAFSKSHRLDAGGPCSYEAAAKLIFCDAKAIPDLITQGYLTFEKGKLVSSLISRESIKSFSAQWVPLRTIAKSLGTSSVRLERLADNAGIQRLVARPTYKGANPSSFIRREDDQRLRAESQKHPARERKIKG